MCGPRRGIRSRPVRRRSAGCRGCRRGTPRELRRAAGGWSRHPAMPSGARRWHRYRVSGWTAASAAGVAATCLQVSACSDRPPAGGRVRRAVMPTAGTSVPPAGSATGWPLWCCAHAMLRSSSRIRHDTASTARWWMISTSWPVEVTHSALSITPAAGFKPRPGLDQCLVGQRVDCVQAIAGVHGAGLGHRERPASGVVIVDRVAAAWRADRATPAAGPPRRPG